MARAVCPSGVRRRPGWAAEDKAFIYECADCGRQTPVTAATIMRANKLPLTIWFWAVFF
jgi:hypothetical protein